MPKTVKETHSDFLTYVLLQNINKIEGGPFETLKSFRKKSHKAVKGGGKVS